MHWLGDPLHIAPDLPAVWLVATAERPANLAERSQLRRSTARGVLARQWGVSEACITIDHRPSGRPVPTGPGSEGAHLSLATRAGLVAVALAAAPVGVDVEEVAAARALPLAMLHPEERQALSSLDGRQQARAFALIWAAKEAYVKALGTGFGRAPESFAVSLLADWRFVIADPQQSRPRAGETRIMQAGGGATVAAAAIVLD